jgi:small membrane protein
MTPFQLLTLPILGLMLCAEFAGVLRCGRASQFGLVRIVIWLAAATAIGFPDLTQNAANLAGIQRGADLVVYVFLLAFLAVTFYFYARHVKVERQLTEIVRQLAIERAHASARNGSPHPKPAP